MKAVPTCFGLQGNSYQGVTTSTWLKIQAWFNVDTDIVQMLSVLWLSQTAHSPSKHKDKHGFIISQCKHTEL